MPDQTIETSPLDLTDPVKDLNALWIRVFDGPVPDDPPAIRRQTSRSAMTRPERCPCRATPADIRKYRSVDGTVRLPRVRVMQMDGNGWPKPEIKVYRPRKSRAKIWSRTFEPFPQDNWQRVSQWMRSQKDGGYLEWVSKQVNKAIARSKMYPTDVGDREQRERFERRAKELRNDVWVHIARKAHLYVDRGLKHGPMAWLQQTVAWFCKDQFKGEKTRQSPTVKGADGHQYTITIYSSGEDNAAEGQTFYRSPTIQTCEGMDVDAEVAEVYLTEVNRRLAAKPVVPQGTNPIEYLKRNHLKKAASAPNP
jgi:hypothetical protein